MSGRFGLALICLQLHMAGDLVQPGAKSALILAHVPLVSSAVIDHEADTMRRLHSMASHVLEYRGSCSMYTKDHSSCQNM